jgi:hypothetical protein
VSTTVAQIDFLSIFSTIYNKYVIEMEGVTTSSDSSALVLMAAVSGATVSGNDVQLFANGNGYPSSSTAAGAVTVEIRNVNASLPTKSVGVRGAYSTTFTINAESRLAVTSALSGFRLYAQSASITGGTVRIYGVRNT